MCFYGKPDCAAMAAAMVDLGGLDIESWFVTLELRRIIGASFVPAMNIDDRDLPHIQFLNASYLEIQLEKAHDFQRLPGPTNIQRHCLTLGRTR